MAEVKPYYSPGGLSAPFYDLTTALDPDLSGDVDIYARLAPEGGRVLELGAGTGRVCLALAERGFTVVGLDLSPLMLAQAEARCQAAPPEIAARVTLVRGDMAALSVPGPFDAIVCPYFGLAHLPAGAAWKNVFGGVAARLAPGGRAAFHLPRADRLAAAPAPPPDRPVLRAPFNDQGQELLVFVHDRRARPEIGRFDQVLDYQVRDAQGRVQASSRERLTYYAADPAPFARSAGLEPDGDPIALGQVGDVHVFRRP